MRLCGVLVLLVVQLPCCFGGTVLADTPNPTTTLEALVRTGAMQQKDAAAISSGLKTRLPNILNNLLNPRSTKILKIFRFNEGVVIGIKTPKLRNHHLPKAKRRKVAKEYEQKKASGQLGAKLKRDIPNCNESRIDATPRKSKNGSYDVLYVRSGTISEQEREFLKGVDIREFSRRSGSIPTLTALDQKVPCLPYRIRLTGNAIERWYGTDALSAGVSQ